MKNGRPKTATNRPARAKVTRGQPADRTLGARNRTRDNTQPRQSSKSSLQAALLRCPGLTDDDQAMLAAGVSEATDLADLRALIVTQAALVNRLHAGGTLAAKDVIVALGKLGGTVAAALQLQAATAGAALGEVVITWRDPGDDDDD